MALRAIRAGGAAICVRKYAAPNVAPPIALFVVGVRIIRFWRTAWGMPEYREWPHRLDVGMGWIVGSG